MSLSPPPPLKETPMVSSCKGSQLFAILVVGLVDAEHCGLLCETTFREEAANRGTFLSKARDSPTECQPKSHLTTLSPANTDMKLFDTKCSWVSESHFWLAARRVCRGFGLVGPFAVKAGGFVRPGG